MTTLVSHHAVKMNGQFLVEP